MAAYRSLIVLGSFLLAGSTGLFAQLCETIDQRDADFILGGSAVPLSVGAHGCSYSVRAKGVRLTLTLLDAGSQARETFENMKQITRKAGWLTGDEGQLGTSAYGELIRRNGPTASGKCGFVVLKGMRIIQLYVSDSAGKEDLAGRNDTLLKLRPIAKKAVDRL